MNYEIAASPETACEFFLISHGQERTRDIILLYTHGEEDPPPHEEAGQKLHIQHHVCVCESMYVHTHIHVHQHALFTYFCIHEHREEYLKMHGKIGYVLDSTAPAENVNTSPRHRLDAVFTGLCLDV